MFCLININSSLNYTECWLLINKYILEDIFMVLRAFVGDGRLGGLDNSSRRSKQAETKMIKLKFSTWVKNFIQIVVLLNLSD